MSIEQFSALIDVLPQIEKALLKRKHQSIPRPEYGGGDAGGGTSARNEQASSSGAAPDMKDEKLNFEATSDEEEAEE